MATMTTLIASTVPSDAPAAAASMTFTCRRPTMVFTSPRVSGSSISEFQIDVVGAGAVPNHLRYAVQGGLETLVHHVAGHDTKVTSTRPSFDHIEYRGEPG